MRFQISILWMFGLTALAAFHATVAAHSPMGLFFLLGITLPVTCATWAGVNRRISDETTIELCVLLSVAYFQVSILFCRAVGIASLTKPTQELFVTVIVALVASALPALAAAVTQGLLCSAIRFFGENADSQEDPRLSDCI